MRTQRMWSGLAGAAAAMTLIIPMSLPAQASVSTDVKATTVDTTDRAYVETLMKAHNTEIEAGKNALATTQNADVRTFAQKLVDDHSKALARLTPVASRLGVSGTMASAMPASDMNTVPAASTMPRDTTLPAPEAGMGAGAMKDSMAMTSPKSPASDKQFIDAMVIGHQQLLGKLPEGGRGVNDKELRSIVGDTRKSVQRHYTIARDIQTKMGGREK